MLVGNEVEPVTALDQVLFFGHSRGEDLNADLDPNTDLVGVLRHYGAKRAAELPKADIQRAFEAHNARSGGRLRLVNYHALLHPER